MTRLLILFLLFTTSCTENTSQDSSGPSAKIPEPSPSHRTKTVRTSDLPESVLNRIQTEKAVTRLTPHVISAPGNVAVDLSHIAKVSSRIPGQIDRILSKLGDRVTKGQPLAAIESLMLDELIQEYLVAKAKRDVAKTNFKRTKLLLDENVVSRRRFQEDRGKYIEEQAVYQHVREKLLNMGLTSQELQELEHGSHVEGHTYSLRAPLSGTIVQQHAVLGQGIKAGEELFEIVNTDHVWIFANLPIEQARRFKEGDQGDVIPRGGKPIAAILAYTAPVAEEATRTIQFRFDVENRDGALKPNEYVEVQLVDTKLPVLAIPTTAVTMINGARGVFVKHETGYDFAEVELGEEGGGLVEVKHGIELGDSFVTDGVFDLKNTLLEGAIEGLGN
ncbi:MAG: efflux RND transporter periplasmic adaptor subunit [Nitrospirales bacterium]|nr:efflux RND transporter periplasmic adaptor subunit [Nitrospira sp.]MDR4502511.1 efflux RND transporter periplasmic adaptor subunit [Nitrospirales bacterium]